MLVVWGTRVRRKRQGVVADVCASCNAVLAHQLIELREVPHFYYVPTGPGKVAGYEVACDTCSSAVEVDGARYEARLDKPIDMRKLVELTNPMAYAELEEQKDREERAKRGDLMPDERLQVMQEALFPVTAAVQEYADGGNIDARTGLCALATLVLPWFLIVPGMGGDHLGNQAVFYAGIAMAVAGVVLTVKAARTKIDRLIRRKHGEAIHAALREFHPSPGELAELIESLRAADTALGKHLDPEWLAGQFFSVGAVSAKPL